MKRRSILLGIVAVAAFLAVLVGFGAYKSQTIGGAAAAPSPGMPFNLVDQRGRVVTDRELLGKPTAMFFGFTYCPEVCPMTLAAMTRWMKALGPDADRLNVVYVTIDPERDTPRQLATYLANFDHRIRGLTGTTAEIAKVAKEYGVYFQKVPLKGGGYTMDHSTAIYLLDAHGGYDSVITYQEPDNQAVSQLRALMDG